MACGCAVLSILVAAVAAITSMPLIVQVLAYTFHALNVHTLF